VVESSDKTVSIGIGSAVGYSKIRIHDIERPFPLDPSKAVTQQSPKENKMPIAKLNNGLHLSYQDSGKPQSTKSDEGYDTMVCVHGVMFNQGMSS